MAYRYTRSKSKQSRLEDWAATRERKERREREFCQIIQRLVPGATQQTFDHAFGTPDKGTYMLAMLYSGNTQLVSELLERSMRQMEEEKQRKREMKELEDTRKVRRRKRIRELEAQLAQLKDEEKQDKEEKEDD